MGVATSNIAYQYWLYKKSLERKNNNINMKIDNYIPTEEEIKIMFQEREKDIKERGKDLSVFDYSGKPTTLTRATVWHKNGIYVKPKPTENLECCIC